MHLRRDACYSGTPGSTIPQKISFVFCGCFCNSCRGDIVAWNIWEASKHHQTISNIQCRPSNKTTRYNRCMSASITNNSAPTPQTRISNLPHDHASKVQLMHCDAAPRDIVQTYIKRRWCGDPQHSQALSCWLCKRLATLTGINCAQCAIWDGCCTNAVTLYILHK